MKEEKKKTKKFNKKYLAFGILGLFVVALVSAGLVNYLSNTTQVEVSVSSPLTLVTADINPITVFGGEVIKIYTTITNHIGEEVYGNYVITITNDLNNVGCTDFDSMNVTIQNGSDAGTYTLEDLSGTCSGSGIVTISIPVMYLPNEVQSYIGLLEFAQNVEPANYSMSSVVNTITI